jgi:nucleotidyltransferase/DNA polymerase involved in DNA repair
MATYKISDIEGVGDVYAKKFAAVNIKTVNALLKKGATKKGRQEIAQATGLDESTILKWVNFADLFRVKGIGSEYSELLEKAGVDTVKELRNRNAENLHAKIVEINEKHKLVRQIPSLGMVKSWIDTAKKLDPVVTY